MAKPKKKFRDTTVGKLLTGAVGIVSPPLAKVLEGASSINDAVSSIIKDNSLTAEQKEHFKLMAHELEIQEFEAEVADRNSARMREVDIARSGGSNLMFNVVGIGVITIWAVTLWALFFSALEITSTNKDLLNIAFGGLSIKVTQIVSYFYGSSSGSKQKTAMMAK